MQALRAACSNEPSSWTTDACSGAWAGVTCTSNVIVALNVSGLNCSQLPTSLGLLSNLTQLVLSAGTISGTVPSELGRLTALSRLGLDTNALSGLLPTQLSALLRLTQYWTIYGNPCVYGPIASVGGMGTLGMAYDISGTALGTWAVPASCSLTLGAMPQTNALDLIAMRALYSAWCVCLFFFGGGGCGDGVIGRCQHKGRGCRVVAIGDAHGPYPALARAPVYACKKAVDGHMPASGGLEEGKVRGGAFCSPLYNSSREPPGRPR